MADAYLTASSLQEVRKGFTWGSVTIVPLQADEEEDTQVVDSTVRSWGPNDRMRIPFQNENLYVIRESPGKADEVTGDGLNSVECF